MHKLNRTLRSTISMVLTIILLGTSCVFASVSKSSNTSDNWNKTLVNVDGYTITIQEKAEPDKSVIREYKNAERIIKNETEIKAILTAVGLNESEIETFTSEQLREFGEATTIGAKVSYTKVNDITGIQTTITEEDAEKEAALINSKRENDSVDSTAGSKSVNPYTDTYMRVSLSWGTPSTSVPFTLYTKATWLTMPSFRCVDCVAVSANYCTLINNSDSAYYQYWEKTTIGGNTTSHFKKYNITNITNPINGNWYGAAATFHLPQDSYDATTGDEIRCSQLMAYVSCKMKVANTGTTSFNGVGSYSHIRVSLSFTPSVSFDGSAGTIAFTPKWKYQQDIRCAGSDITVY